MRKALLVAVLLLVPVASAAAQAPLVPAATQTQLLDLTSAFGKPELDYMPTTAPQHYELVNFGAGQNQINFTVADSRYPIATKQERAIFFFFNGYNGSAKKCQTSKDGMTTVGKVKVYFEGYAAWRCVLAPNGKLVQLKAESSIIARTTLAGIVAAIKRIK